MRACVHLRKRYLTPKLLLHGYRRTLERRKHVALATHRRGKSKVAAAHKATKGEAKRAKMRAIALNKLYLARRCPCYQLAGSFA